MSFRLSLIVLALLTPLAMAQSAAGQDAAGCIAKRWAHHQLKCLIKVARKADDVKLCLRSTKVGVRWRCVARYAQYKSDATICDSVADANEKPPFSSRGQCRSQIAIAFKRPALCATIADAGITDGCYLGIAVRHKDPRPCAEIKSKKLRRACRTGVKAR